MNITSLKRYSHKNLVNRLETVHNIITGTAKIRAQSRNVIQPLCSQTKARIVLWMYAERRECKGSKYTLNHRMWNTEACSVPQGHWEHSLRPTAFFSGPNKPYNRPHAKWATIGIRAKKCATPVSWTKKQTRQSPKIQLKNVRQTISAWKGTGSEQTITINLYKGHRVLQKQKKNSTQLALWMCTKAPNRNQTIYPKIQK